MAEILHVQLKINAPTYEMSTFGQKICPGWTLDINLMIIKEIYEKKYFNVLRFNCFVEPLSV